MTEEVKVRSFSEMAGGPKWEPAETMLVIKKGNVCWNQYWSEEKKKFGPLLEATIYNEKPTELAEGWEIVNYRDVISGK